MVEKSPRPDALTEEKSRIATQFKNIVDQAIAPTLRKRDRGIFSIYQTPYLIASREIDIDIDSIEFMRFREPSPEEKSSIRGIQFLDFIPTHAVEILIRKAFVNRTITQTMFALRADNKIVRSHHVTSKIIGPTVIRELELEESQALIDYLASPHLNQDQRAIIMNLTPNEEERIQQALAEDSKAAAALEEQLRSIDESRRRAYLNTRNTFIY